MAAPQPNNTPRARRAEVEFPPNIPVTVALRYAQPKGVGGSNGERFMFSTTDNRVLFLDAEPASQIAQLGINVREEFSITKRTDGKRGSPVSWEVARIAAQPGQQPDGTFAVPKLPPSPAASAGGTAATPKPAALATAATPGDESVVEEAKRLIDDFAEALEYGLTKYQGKLKPDEIRSLTVTAYIEKMKRRAERLRYSSVA